MKKKGIKITALILFILIIVGMVMYHQFFSWKEQTVYAMDTIITIKIKGTSAQLERLMKQIETAEKELNVYDPECKLYQANQNGGGTISQMEADLIAKALDYCRLTDGCFDLTVKSVTDLWGVTSENPRVPESGEIKDALERVDYRFVHCDGQQLVLENQAQIDVGAIAKGYVTDLLVQQLRQDGVKEAILDLGGNIYSFGKDKFHTIGIQKPFAGRGEVVASIEVADQAVVTSGIYERMFEQDGIQYHHIFDPATGYPVQNGIQSVTVVGQNAAMCDALSTAILVMGEDGAKDFRKENPNIEFLMVEEGKIVMTKGLEAYTTILDQTLEREVLA